VKLVQFCENIKKENKYERKNVAATGGGRE
jgi:hypothetical protein